MSVFTLENIKRLVRAEVSRANTATALAVAKNADKVSREIADATARGRDNTTIFCPSGICGESTECLQYLNQVKEELGKAGVRAVVGHFDSGYSPSYMNEGFLDETYFYLRVHDLQTLRKSSAE